MAAKQYKKDQRKHSYVWLDISFYGVCASLYVTKDPEYATALFKYMHTIC